MLLLLLTLIDVHTLFILLFHEYLNGWYIFSGTVFAMLKGLVFYAISRDLFSLFDIITGILILFLLFGGLWSIFFWPVFFFLTYKVVMGLVFLKF